MPESHAIGTGLMLAAFMLAASQAIAADPKPTHYVSQRGKEASLRQGPGFQYPVIWVYRHRGYPFQVTARFDVWRRVTGPDGVTGWMSAAMLSDARSVIVTGKARAQIRANAEADSKVTGLADPGAIAGVKACERDACRIAKEGIDGWIAKDRIWGVGKDEIIK